MPYLTNWRNYAMLALALLALFFYVQTNMAARTIANYETAMQVAASLQSQLKASLAAADKRAEAAEKARSKRLNDNLKEVYSETNCDVPVDYCAARDLRLFRRAAGGN